MGVPGVAPGLVTAPAAGAVARAADGGDGAVAPRPGGLMDATGVPRPAGARDGTDAARPGAGAGDVTGGTGVTGFSATGTEAAGFAALGIAICRVSTSPGAPNTFGGAPSTESSTAPASPTRTVTGQQR